MNRKQFLILVVALLVLGGAGLAMFWQDIAAYRTAGSKIGGKLLPNLKIADLAQLELRDAKNRVTLVRKENHWVVQERDGYPADFKAISDFVIKLSDLKIVQADTVGESLLPRVELVEPGKGEGAGTLVELKDAGGKTLAAVVLGKKVLKKDPGNPLPSAQDGVPAARYIRVLDEKNQVVVVSDPLAAAEAQPGRWLDKDFAKIERVKTLSVESDNGWKITRDEEWGQWKFAGGGGDLDPSGAVSAVNSLGQLSFNDVVAGAKPEEEGKPVTITADTFDNLVYTVRLAKRKGSEDYLLSVNVSGEPPRERQGEKGEKAEDKERRDKDFAESRKRLELRIARDKARSAWTYVVDAKQVAPLLKPRGEMQRKPQADRKQ
ncbi:MAG TPA: DUF4340 domain-containing protein [Burkholderiales bacterium]|nr:DUF4340 domain-containing protein [Burkholderiales bacterium]